MSDPFPDEATVIEQDNQLLGDQKLTMENLVYPKERYKKGIIPLQIYIPSKQIMLKMIKACIGCESKEDLWFNRTNDMPIDFTSG